MARALVLAGLWSIVVVGGPINAFAATLEDFFGAFVGVATVEGVEGGGIKQRDMDIVIEPYQGDGFQVHWVNVSLIDGRRDVPGVERRAQSVLFAPAADTRYFVEVQQGSLFQEGQAMQPLAGHAVRWAALFGDTLRVTTFQVLEDGRYEMQIYDRQLTDTGLDVDFQRIVDDVVVRRIVGRTARANMEDAVQ